jgi:hypothetical protein
LPISPGSIVSLGATVPADFPARAYSRWKFDEWKPEAIATLGSRAEVAQDLVVGQAEGQRAPMESSSASCSVPTSRTRTWSPAVPTGPVVEVVRFNTELGRL